MKKHHIFLVDGSGYIFRAYHALPPLYRKRDGVPTGAVLGFVNMLSKLLEKNFVSGNSTHIAIVFDTGKQTFRNEIFPDYKSNRDETPEDLMPQFNLIRDAVRSFSVALVEKEGFEADDIIATYSKLACKEGYEVLIVSSDKDLMQLVQPGVTMYDPMKNRHIGESEVIEKFGVGPQKVIDVQSLAGDSADNIPGVPGIGIKTASQLIREYGNLDELLARADEVKQPKRRERLVEFAENARLSRKLVTLRDDLELDQNISDFAFQKPNAEELLRFFEEMEFNNLASKLRAKIQDSSDITVKGHAEFPGEVGLYYSIARNIDELNPWISKARELGCCAVRFVTDGGKWRTDPLVGFALSLESKKAIYVPIKKKTEDNQEDFNISQNASSFSADILANILRPLFESAGILKIAHDGKGLLSILARLGIKTESLADIMVMSYDTAAGLHSHDIESLIEEYLDIPFLKWDDCMGKGKDKTDFCELSDERACDYLAGTADAIFQLWNVFRQNLIDNRVVGLYETIDRPLLPVLLSMENMGIRVDKKILEAVSRDFKLRLEGLERDIYTLAGRKFNVGSPKQLGEILFEEMGLEGGRKGKGGAWGTSAEVLEEIASQGFELAQKVLDWRQLAKLKNTYTDKLPKQISRDSERIHTNYEVAVTNTGRLSSNDPNLQNIPVRTEDGRKIRSAFIADSGWKILCADYSQIELRLLAHIADIPQLDEAFKKGIDIHAMTASEVFSIPVRDMPIEVRRRAKAINFGIIYGISAYGLAKQLAIPNGQARDYIKSYFDRFPGIKIYMEEQKNFCRDNGYVKTLFGRRIHLPGIKDKNPTRRSFAERQAINAPLQGAAADIIKLAMIAMPEKMQSVGSHARMLLQVHDELIFEVPDSELLDTGKLIKETMEKVAQLKVPLIVELRHGKNWGDAH